MSYYTVDSINGEPVFLGFACDAGDDDRMDQFCDAVVGNTSREFMNGFAYAVLDCVRARGRVTHLVTGDEYTSGLRYNRGRSLKRMDGRIGDTVLVLRERDAGFQLTFQRQANR